MDFSIIIINHRTKDLTAACLDSLLSNLSGSYEVIVVDNASGDGSLESLRGEYADRVTFIPSEENLGFSKANNLAAKQAKGENLLFMNSDTLCKEDILPAMKEALSVSGVGLAGPRLLLADGKEQPASFGGFPTLFSIVFKGFGKDSSKEGPDWISGAALAIKSDLFHRLGGFDESYFMYFEDIDLCLRAKRLGYSTVIVDMVDVVHLVSGSPAPRRKESYYMSQDVYCRKHLGPLASLVVRLARSIYLMIKTK